MLFDQLPPEGAEEAVRILVDKPSALGRSYPANAGWHMWALAKAGRIDQVLDEWRERWFPMASVQQNNTLQEAWRVAPDSGSQWSHIPVAPLYVLFMSVAGIQPLYAEAQIPEYWIVKLDDQEVEVYREPVGDR